jgi:F-type H+-transporting ATPase subunit delta
MSLATSYAKALYQAAKEIGTSDSLDQLENQMDAFAQALQDKGIRDAILGPVISSKEKIALIEHVAQKASFSKILTHFLILLTNKGRLAVFLPVRDAFSAVRLEAEGGVAGRVVSAEPMSDADVQGLAQAFGRKLGKKVAFRVSTDPSLLAGMKVTVNGTTYDGTLRSQLVQLRDRLVAAQ